VKASFLTALWRSNNFYLPFVEFLANVAVLRSEDQLVNSVTERTPSIVVLGQDYGSKLGVVNALLGQTILPANVSKSPSGGWRMLRIIYGLQKSLSLALAGNFEVIDSTLARIGGCTETVPFDDFMLQVSSFGPNSTRFFGFVPGKLPGERVGQYRRSWPI
jgi:hypothetical protein